ncbi:MAG: peptide chain release factor 1 [Hyphomicrobiaceae bacterium]
MTSIPREKLEKVIERHLSLEAALSTGGLDQTAFVASSKEYAELTPVVGAIRRLTDAETEREDLEAMLADPTTDREMRELAQAEMPALAGRVEELTKALRVMLLPKDAADEGGAILEVRAGTGGDEAALFAADLFRMYQRYADKRGWKVELVSISEGDLGGIKEAIASIKGKGVFARLKFESGVHRVQRVPATEASGRIHTSAATVAVLPEAEDIDIEVRNEDIRIDTMRSSGAGGQHVNTTDSAVRITHLPTGIVVTSNEKSQHQNRAKAMQVLKSRLFDLERQKADQERAQARKSQVGSGDRSQKIRTYNFPQGRVTDHRINLSLYNIQAVIDGGLDELLDALIAEDQANRLLEWENA